VHAPKSGHLLTAKAYGSGDEGAVAADDPVAHGEDPATRTSVPPLTMFEKKLGSSTPQRLGQEVRELGGRWIRRGDYLYFTLHVGP
jgi:hypothetical protein